MSTVQGIFGFLLGSTRPSTSDTVISVKHTVLAVAWLAINQAVCHIISLTRLPCITDPGLQLSPEVAATKPRPQRYWYGNSLGDLTIVSRRAEEAMRVGDRVRLRNNAGVPVTRHGRSPDGQGSIEVDTLIVQETRTSVDVLWQDGTRETQIGRAHV